MDIRRHLLHPVIEGLGDSVSSCHGSVVVLEYTLWLRSRLGLGDSNHGIVLRSGIQTTLPEINEDTYVRRQPSAAAVFRRCVVGEYSPP